MKKKYYKIKCKNKKQAKKLFERLIKDGWYPYNWYHKDEKNIAPDGWHVPTKEDLKNYDNTGSAR